MNRNPDALCGTEFDLLIVGGGIHGACVARDAALRGLKVALIEQSDFSSATSHNSLKTIHGGIRYLQHLNFRRAIESIREQQILLRTAPQWIKPLHFLMPNYGWGMRGPLAMGAGIAMFEALCFCVSLVDRRKPRNIQSKLLTRGRCLKLANGIDSSSLTGGTIWADAQVEMADKAIFQLLQHAEDHGAIVANYIGAQQPLKNEPGTRVVGVLATDKISHKRLEIRAKLVVNAAGPWIAHWLNEVSALRESVSVKLVKSMNLVTRLPAPQIAIGIKSQRASDSKVDTAKRMFFMVPWLGKAVIGTSHFTHRDNTPTTMMDENLIKAFVDEFAQAYPALQLTHDDVLYCYQGLTPGDDSTDEDGAKLHHSKVVDHASEDQIDGIVSIIGIKWTTARLVAEQAVDLAMQKLGQSGRCQTRHVPVPDYQDMPHDTEHLSDEDLREFTLTHVRHTQARKLTDIVLRRTNDLVLEKMRPQTVKFIHQSLAEEFSWDQQQELDAWNELLDSGLSANFKKKMKQLIPGVMA